MNRFFNMIPSNESCCILLYGYIGEGCSVDSATINAELLEAEQQYRKIDVRINSIGGEVYTGIAIFNALRMSKADITIYIDGVAASMASVIAACGKPVKMGKYARMMIHSPSCGAYGNRDDLKAAIVELDALEGTLCDIYAGRCGKSKQEIKSSYFDGKDHWLTAEEALNTGLIDEIFDTDPVPAEITNDELYKEFNNRLERKKQPVTMFDKLRKRPQFANCATEADAEQRIEELEASAAKSEALKKELDEYKKKERERIEKEDDQIIEQAAEQKKIAPEDKPTYKAMLKADRENGRKIIDSLKPMRMVTDVYTGGKGGENKIESAWEARQREIQDRKQKQ